LKPVLARSAEGRTQEAVFWEMLSAYEEATILEAKLLSAREFDQLELLSERKGGLLQKMGYLGGLLGLDRSHPALRERLLALQEAERMNLEVLSSLVSQARRAGEDLLISRRKLNSVRGVYAGGSVATEFLGEA
jgi:hypothetical protein